VRLEMHGPVVRVVLSRRNLRALLAKLEGHPPGSACTLTYRSADGPTLIVSAEPDAVHYVHPERDHPGVRGAMHPDTEKRIRDH
jgi:hypothetical protein